MPKRNGEQGAISHVSTFSGGGSCVRVVKATDDTYTVEHSTAGGPGVCFTRDQWKAFVRGVKAGEFDF